MAILVDVSERDIQFSLHYYKVMQKKLFFLLLFIFLHKSLYFNAVEVHLILFSDCKERNSFSNLPCVCLGYMCHDSTMELITNIYLLWNLPASF